MGLAEWHPALRAARRLLGRFCRCVLGIYFLEIVSTNDGGALIGLRLLNAWKFVCSIDHESIRPASVDKHNRPQPHTLPEVQTSDMLHFNWAPLLSDRPASRSAFGQRHLHDICATGAKSRDTVRKVKQPKPAEPLIEALRRNC